MSRIVYVVTMPELGWDCVVGVFSSEYVSEERLNECFSQNQYVIHTMAVEKDVDRECE